MPTVLTESSTLICDHTGAVELVAGQSKLTVNGSKVLVDGDLSGKLIDGCLTAPDPSSSTVKCLRVVSAIGGVASKLRVRGKGVLLQGTEGLTDGTVGGTPQKWSVQNAGQTKLETV